MLAGFVVYRFLAPNLPLSQPVIVEGGDEPVPLSVALGDFDPDEIVTVIPWPKDAIPAIDVPQLVPAEEVDLRDQDRIIGIEVGSEARAYPIKVLSAHEIVNDEIQGKPFAVTWCPLCFTAVVYDRKIMGRTLSFGVSGKLYRNNLIMYDRQTGSLWSQLLGGAVKGRLAGARLQTIPSTLTQWGDWRTRHPDTLVLSPALSPYGRYGSDTYDDYYTNAQIGVLGVRRKDSRLKPKARVLGLLAPAAQAYALADLERLGWIVDTVSGRTVEIVYKAEAGSAEAFLVAEGSCKRLPSTPIFWFAWVDIFPGAPLWEGKVRPAVAEAHARIDTQERICSSAE